MYRAVAVLYGLFAALMLEAAQAQDSRSFDLAVGVAGTDSFVFGTELWAVTQIELLPDRGFGLDTVPMRSTADRLRYLDDGQVDFALVPDDVPAALARNLRAVMALWPNGAVRSGAEPSQLLVHRDVSAAAVYQITKTIFDHQGKLLGARATLGIGSPDDAVLGLSLPIHPGAHLYYTEHGSGAQHAPASSSRRAPAVPAQGRLDNDEVLQLEAACRDAVERGALDDLDGHDLADICRAPGVAAGVTDALDLSLGRGGPKLSAVTVETRVRPSDPARRGSKVRGLRPTM